MATPVIDSFTADKTTVAPGDTVTFTLVAHSPATQDVTVTGTATSSTGAFPASPATVVVHVVDAFTASVTAAGYTAVAVAGKTGVYTVKF